MRINIIITFLLLKIGGLHSQSVHNTEFFVLNENSESVVNAHLLLNDEFTLVTNQAGYASIKLESDQYLMQVKHISYNNLSESVNISSDTTIVVVLTSNILETIEIQANQKSEINQLSDININQLKTIPGITGNKDVIKSLTFLPGVSTTTEGSVNFSVRGGDPYQNAILLDRSPVFNISHLFGLLSTVNGEMVNDVKLYKNYIPARFGNAGASVVDINIKKGNNSHFKHKLEAGITNLSYNINGPVIKDKLHLNVGLRSAFLGVLSSPLYFAYKFGASEGYSNYNLLDGNFKLSYTPTKKDRLSIHFYNSLDNIFTKSQVYPDNENRFSYSWGNRTLNLSYYKTLNNGIFLNNYINYSTFNTSLRNKSTDKTEEPVAINQFDRSSLYNNFNFQSEVNKSFGSLLFRGGLHVDYSWFNPLRLRNVVSSESLPIAENYFNIKSIAVFTDNDYNFSKAIKLNFGIRLNYYQNETISKLIPEPRASLKYRLKDDSFLEFSYSKLSQNRVQYPIVNFGLPLDIWIPVYGKVSPPVIHQFNVSYVNNSFFYENLIFTASTYYKSLNKLTTLSSVLPFIVEFDDDYENYLYNNGKGEAYGAEASFEFNSDRVKCYLSYHLGYAFRQFDKINGGEKYPFEYNRKHEMTSYVDYQISKKWDFLLSFNFYTGNPVTLPTAYFELNEDFNFYLFERRNNFRNALYHRGDVAFTHTKKTKRDRLRKWTISVYNFYYNKNVYDTILELGENGSFDLQERSVFPIIPMIYYSLEF